MRERLRPLYICVGSVLHPGGITLLHCSGNGSNGIELMTKLIEGLMPVGNDKVVLSPCVHTVGVLLCVAGLH